MNKVGQIERATQNRIVKLFKDKLKYAYLGNWEERPDNRNIEETLLRTFIKERKVNEALVTRALYELNRVAGDQSRDLYYVNKDVYELLRYGVKVKAEHRDRVAY